MARSDINQSTYMGERKIKIKIFLFVLSMVALLGFPTAQATAYELLKPIPQESGYSGFVRLGLGRLGYASNVVAATPHLSFFRDLELSQKVNSVPLNSPPKTVTTFPVTIIPFEAAYTAADTRSQFFIGTEPLELLRFDHFLRLGVKQGISNLGDLEVGLLLNHVPTRVWQDPLKTGARRNEDMHGPEFNIRRIAKREVIGNGYILGLNRVFGTGLGLRYTQKEVSVYQDRNGDHLFCGPDPDGQGMLCGEFEITPAEYDVLMKRDGTTLRFAAAYRIDLPGAHTLQPGLAYTKNHLSGSAMSNNAWDFKLTYACAVPGNPLSFEGSAYLGWTDYDAENPVFDKTQKDSRRGIQATLFYENPWGWAPPGGKPMKFFVGVDYADTDANIDFYDQRASLWTAGVLLKW